MHHGQEQRGGGLSVRIWSAAAGAQARGARRYILPSLSLLPTDGEEAVRVEYARAIAPLAAASHSVLLRLQHAAAAQAAAATAASPSPLAGSLVRLRRRARARSVPSLPHVASGGYRVNLTLPCECGQGRAGVALLPAVCSMQPRRWHRPLLPPPPICRRFMHCPSCTPAHCHTGHSVPLC